MGEDATVAPRQEATDMTGRNYVVVSADTHASPDSLDHFLSYVDPDFRERVAAFGDMSNLAISMFGGFDPGEVDESDPVRATAARRLAGMGVRRLPWTLGEAVDAFEESSFVQKVLGAELHAAYAQLKREEWQEYNTVVGEWEQARYLRLW